MDISNIIDINETVIGGILVASQPTVAAGERLSQEYIVFYQFVNSDVF